MGQELDNVGQRDLDFVIDGTRCGPRYGADERGIFVVDPVDQLVQHNAFKGDFRLRLFEIYPNRHHPRRRVIQYSFRRL
jgi:hypothetical protein